MGHFLLAIALVQASVAGAPVSPAPQESRLAARERYEEILAREPGNRDAQDGEVDVSERLALAARAAHDPKGALTALLRAEKLVPQSARLVYDLGVLEEQLALYRDADTTVEDLRKLTPGDPKMLYLAARIELDLGRLTTAEQDMRGYLQAHPDDATAHFGLGRILQQAQQPDAAKAEFGRSVELRPVQTESFYQLAQLALEGGDFQAALDDNAQVLKRDPHHGGALTGTGIAYFRTRQFSLAEQVLQRAITDAPDYQLGHYYYGLTLARLGKKEQSDRELALAAKMAEDTNRKEAQRLRLNP